MLRAPLFILSLHICVCALLMAAQASAAEPASWQPAYWDETMLAAKTARDRGDKSQAEGLCFQAIGYVERQAIRALNDYAALLDSQKKGSGSEVRARADRLAQVKEMQRRATKPGNAELGFVVWDELGRYADALQGAGRESEALATRELATAYKHSQEAFVNRIILMHEGKDPRGEC